MNRWWERLTAPGGTLQGAPRRYYPDDITQEPMTMTVTPTVGRIVWYYPWYGTVPPPGGQPRPAIIAFVNNDGTVNLGWWNVDGSPGAASGAQSVPLVQEGTAPPTNAAYCRFPDLQPYAPPPGAQGQQRPGVGERRSLPM